jgi:hypothetical protein
MKRFERTARTVMLLLLSVMLAQPARAQFITISVETARTEGVTATETLDFRSDDALNDGLNDLDGDMAGRDAAVGGFSFRGACMAISARENIEVLVEVGRPVLLLNGRSEQVVSAPEVIQVEPRWFNDGAGCPANAEVGRRVTRDFTDGSARFRLSSDTRLLGSMEGRPRSTTGHLYLLGALDRELRSGVQFLTTPGALEADYWLTIRISYP